MITYESIEKVNSEIKTVEIHQKDYAEVPQRIKAFRKIWPTGSIQTEMISYGNGEVIMKATVNDENGMVLATGYARETVNNNPSINKNSLIENCETSAVGRALGFIALGIDCAVASAYEMAKADAIPDAPKTEAPKTASSSSAKSNLNLASEAQKKKLWAMANALGKNIDDYYKEAGCDANSLTKEKAKELINSLEAEQNNVSNSATTSTASEVSNLASEAQKSKIKSLAEAVGRNDEEFYSTNNIKPEELTAAKAAQIISFFEKEVAKREATA